jgi:predicted ATPase
MMYSRPYVPPADVLAASQPPEGTPPWYVLTGGPCAGKTTTIDALAKRGHPVLAEPARLIIDEKLAAGHTIEEIVSDPDWLPSVARRAVAQEAELPRDELFFLDRAAPDSCAYYRHFKRANDADLESGLTRGKYRKVFLLDLIDFKNDEARHEDPEEAAIIHRLIREAYEELGYEIIEVPVMEVEKRADFILERL